MRCFPTPLCLMLLWPLAAACLSAPTPQASVAPPPAAVSASTPEQAIPTESTEAIPVKVGLSGVSGGMIVPWATYEGGYFAKYGLRVDELQAFQATTVATQALLAGDVDFVGIGGDAPIAANLSAGNADLVMIANTTPSIALFIYARPEIRTLEDLRGKTVGANRPGTNTYFAANRYLRDHGLLPGSDVHIVTTGAVPATVAAIEVNQVQAGILSPPSTIKARQLGLKELADLSYIPFNSQGPVVRRGLLAENRPLVRRYLQATLEATARVRQDKAFAKRVLAKWTEITDDDELEELYRVYRPPEIPWVSRDGTLTILEEAVERMPAAASADPERFYDTSVLQELQASGFVARLYGQ
jgi:ABC-type nitrate/sulfonate/bicarbonate transport system substrate-binding protein